LCASQNEFRKATRNVTQALLSAVYISLLSIVGENLATRLRRGLFESLIKQDMAFFDARQTGEIVGRLTNDVQGAFNKFIYCLKKRRRSERKEP
jgi:ATP-binding cassette subfamily B (MDR/TAP) protein 8